MLYEASKDSFTLRSLLNLRTKPIGPIYACVKNKNIKDSLPSYFLNTYIVDSLTDSQLLKTLCEQHNEPVPDHIIYSFSEKPYDNLDKDPKADKGIIARLKEKNPTVANVLADHLNIHIMGIHSGKHFEHCIYFNISIHYLTDPDNKAMDDFEELLNVESPNGYGKYWNIRSYIDNFPNNIEIKSESTRRDSKADAVNVMVWLTSSYGMCSHFTIIG